MMESPAVFSAFQFSLSILVGKEATSQSRAIEGYITIEQHLQLTTHFRNLRPRFDSQEYFLQHRGPDGSPLIQFEITKRQLPVRTPYNAFLYGIHTH